GMIFASLGFFAVPQRRMAMSVMVFSSARSTAASSTGFGRDASSPHALYKHPGDTSRAVLALAHDPRPRPRAKPGPHRPRPCRAGISPQARPRGRGAARPAGPERPAPDLPRQLRLAFLRARPLDPGAGAAAAAGRSPGERHRRPVRPRLHPGQGRGRARLSRPVVVRDLRAPLRLGLAAETAGRAPGLARAALG